MNFRPSVWGSLAVAAGSGVAWFALQTAASAMPAPTPEPAPTVAALTGQAYYTAAQAGEGEIVYRTQCASCHGDGLEGGAGPALAGKTFIDHWATGTKTLDDLAYIIKSMMPLQAPRSLSDKQYNAVVAHILSRNGYPAGTMAFNPEMDPATAKSVLVPPGMTTATHKPHVRPVLPQLPAKVEMATTSKPDDAEIAAADDSVWLMYNKSLNGQRFSRLNQINTDNAKNLSATCIFQAGEIGAFQASPVIYDGMMYITTPFNTYALNPKTCEKLWEHRYPADLATTVSLSRGVAIYRGKLFRVTPNGHMIAIDAKTGKELWDVWMADKAHGYWLSAAPVAFDGKVFIGTAGADWGANGYIYAFDVETGKEVWRFSVIPTGKEVGAHTWKSGSEKGGGSMWSTMAIDQETGELLASIGNPAPDYNGAMRPGDNLFTNSVIALDYKSGKINWWVQQVPHDVHDWDTASAPALYDQDGKKLMAVGSKGGWVFIYDRKKRKKLAQVEVSPHENVDVPMSPEGVHHCPGIIGGVQWNGTAYSPDQKALFVNSVHWCGTTRLSENRYIEGSSYFDGDHTWDPASDARGYTRALDAMTGKELWAREFKAPMVSALTPTAGGLVFTGDMNGNFLALDGKTGNTLYSFNTGGAIAGAASTYLVDGKQYVAITSGNSSRSVWKTSGAMTVVVFALPGQ